MSLLRLSSLSLLALATAAPTFAQIPPVSSLPPAETVSMVRKLNPVYPLDLLLKGKTGSAEVRFMVDYSGRPVMTSVTSATTPAFGQALLADVESNEFMPPRINGKPQLTLSGQRYSFNGEAGLDPSEKRILAELRRPKPAIVPAGELDKPLVPTRKDAPVYPFALQSDGLSGKAEVEFIVDHDGHVCFPKILSSTQDDFGWAVATALTRWRYNPPTKGGQKVDARATIVMKFDHTKGTVTW